jgi:hypothetical protein
MPEGPGGFGSPPGLLLFGNTEHLRCTAARLAAVKMSEPERQFDVNFT